MPSTRVTSEERLNPPQRDVTSWLKGWRIDLMGWAPRMISVAQMI